MQHTIFLEDLEARITEQLPFVVYKKPRQTSVNALLQDDDALHTIHDFTQSGFVFAPFKGDAHIIKGKKVFVSTKENQQQPLPQPSIVEDMDSRQKHVDLVQRAVDAIRSTPLKKVVLSRQQNVPSTVGPLQVFNRLAAKYKNAFTYYVYHPKIGQWLGATPEKLLKISGNTYETMSLAGTQLDQGQQEVAWGAKEQEEQQMVTDEIISRLREINPDTIHVGERQTHKAGSLLHLRTKISGRLPQGSDVSNLIKALHPTPAVCGLPRKRAKDFILANEGYDRKYYTGFLGELNLEETNARNKNRRNVENSAYYSMKKTSDLYVNLRCMEKQPDGYCLYLGGGITASSNPAAEWEETVNKAQTMGSVI
ncbi:MAG: isochorismate synthase [Cytophagaceae bacterium]|nr:isochorismate synthase [Cytophagaceae bacterium]|tara:strand:- start:39 stop:1139 length:1101 start_codon:yes stop_codon:yes gene_type:complete